MLDSGETVPSLDGVGLNRPMPGKIFMRMFVAGFMLAASLAVLVPAVAISYWATPQWIKKNLLPPLENYLGRSITFHEFSIGLDGVYLDGFSMSDDVEFPRHYRDFITAERVAVRLDLTRLFQGKIVIQEVKLVGAIIALHKNKQGQFNTDSLLPWHQLTISDESGSAMMGEQVLVETLDVRNGSLHYFDDSTDRELPLEIIFSNVDIRASHIVANRPFDLFFDARLELTRAEPINMRSRITFTPDDAPLKIDAEIDRLNVAELVYGLNPVPLPLPPRTGDIPPCPIEIPHLDARISVGRLETLRSVFENVRLSAELEHNRIYAGSATADLAGGSLYLTGDLDLNKRGWAYNLNLRIAHAKAEHILKPVWKDSFGSIAGAMSCDVRLKSTGTLPKVFLDNLFLEGNVRFPRGRINGNPVLGQIAKLTGMGSFRDLNISDAGGNVLILNRVIRTDKMVIGGPDAKLIFTGALGFNGALETEMWAGVHPEKGREFFSKGMLLPYIRDKDRWTYIPIVLSGDVRAPQSAIAPGAVAETAINLIPDVTEQLLIGGARTTTKIIKGSARKTGEILKGGADVVGSIWSGLKNLATGGGPSEQEDPGDTPE